MMLLNLRDAGGMPTIHGRSVRGGVLLRSAAPMTAVLGSMGADEGRRTVMSALQGLDTRTVVDLRDDGEISREQSAHGGIDGHIVRAPVDTSLVVSDGTSGAVRRMFDADDLGHLYLDFFDRAGTAFGSAVRAVAGGAGATLIHCTLGKDRTGVAVALMLSIAEVDEEEIVRDYTRTADAMPAILERIRAATLTHDEDAATAFDWSQVPPIVLEAPARAMEVFLEGLAERGGAVSALRQVGVPAETIVALRNRLVG